MKIKRYTAPSMRAALAQVRAEQGADAVILSSRRGDEGIEVIAAVDYDEALFVDMNRQRSAAASSAISPAVVESPTVAPVPTAASAGGFMSSAEAASAPATESASRRRAESTRPGPASDIASPTQAPQRQTGRTPSNGVSAANAPAGRAQSAGTSAASAPAGRTPLAGVSAASASAGRAPSAGVSAAGALAGHASSAGASVASASAGRTASAGGSAASPSAVRPAPEGRGAGVVQRTPAPRQDAGYVAMTRELQDMRQLLENGLAGMTWNDKRLREPLRARVLEELWAMDIAPDVAEALAAKTPRRTSLDDPSHIPLALLVKYLPIVDDLASMAGGIMALVGPTGAGKTTTIAKLAARWCMQHGNQDLALVSTDGYRIGAREQLMTYGRILGVPTHAANSGMELGRVLGRLKSKKMILIDTAGMGPRDVRLTEQLAALKLGAARATVLLALPAQGEGHALDEICRAYERAAPAACIITKVDEAASLGAVLSATLRHKLKIAYVCDGQQVPDDLHAAHRKRVWLLRAALKLKDRRSSPRDAAYLARQLGRAAVHA